MALAELETAARLALPMAIVVYNDSAYGAEVHHFGPMGHEVDLTQFPDVDFAAIGRAAGAEAITVRSVRDLAPFEDWLGRRAGGNVGPIVIDAKVTPTVVADWLADAFQAH
jgi:thiamine pyrophosphate-dependent acetolactate synthase large subunit-like protein